MDELIELGRQLRAGKINQRSYRSQTAGVITVMTEDDLCALAAVVTVFDDLAEALRPSALAALRK
jgi:hypothetical protein